MLLETDLVGLVFNKETEGAESFKTKLVIQNKALHDYISIPDYSGNQAKVLSAMVELALNSFKGDFKLDDLEILELAGKQGMYAPVSVLTSGSYSGLFLNMYQENSQDLSGLLIKESGVVVRNVAKFFAENPDSSKKGFVEIGQMLDLNGYLKESGFFVGSTGVHGDLLCAQKNQIITPFMASLELPKTAKNYFANAVIYGTHFRILSPKITIRSYYEEAPYENLAVTNIEDLNKSDELKKLNGSLDIVK